MPITSSDPQPPRTATALPSASSAPPPEAASAVPSTGPVDPVPASVGVVFVHGIGTQGPAETFLDWSAPIVRLLRGWRSGEGHPGDPVIRATFAFNALTPPLLELGIPASAGLPPSRWLMTEAWWAADLRPPALSTVIPYLRARLGRIVDGIAAGYASREGTWTRRRASSGGGRRPRRWAWVDVLDRIQARAFSVRLVLVPLTLLGSLVLAGYGLLRRIPIGPIRDFAELRIADSFLVDWFGDLPVLLDDPVQVANVRARVAEAIDRLRSGGADAIVLVAHSGGAIVSFETLLDPAYLDRPVDKLVTLGQGLSLGWRLDADPDRLTSVPGPGDRLVGDLGALRPNLHWVDVWASYDPAPAGPLRPIPGVPLDVVDAAEADALEAEGEAPPHPLVVESRPVTNRMNVLADHGAYWDNDEGFLVPLVRHLDAARGAASASRFYRDPALRADRIERRRERVAILAAWDWLCSLAAISALVLLGVVAAVGHVPTLSVAGDTVAGLVALVPGHQLVTTPVAVYGSVVGWFADAAGLGALADAVGALGPAAVGGIVVVALFLAVASIGNGRWEAWDRAERARTAAEVPAFGSRRPAAGDWIAVGSGLAAVWLAVVAAAFGFGWEVVALVAVVGWIAGLVVRSTGRVTGGERARRSLAAD